MLRRIGDMDKIKARLDAALAAQKEGKRGIVRTVVVGAGYIGMACPGPIMRRAGVMKAASVGDEIRVTVSDPAFALDAPAWASKNGHKPVDMTPKGPGHVATFRKGVALAIGQEVSMFFTFWGLNGLRKTTPPKRRKKMMDKMFGVMTQHNVPTLPDMITAAPEGGLACLVAP